jgi:uncharacterized membrane protein
MADEIFIYPSSGKPDTVHYNVVSKKPSQDEVEKLTSIPLEKKPLSGEERKAGYENLRMTAIGIGAGIVSFLLLIVVPSGRGGGIVRLMLFTIILCAPVLAIVGIILFVLAMFSSAQKKNPEKSLKWIFEKSYFADSASSEYFGNIEYGIKTLGRIIPNARNFNENSARDYISTVFRKTLQDKFDERKAEAGITEKDNWTDGVKNRKITVNNKKEIYPGIVELFATLDYRDVFSQTIDKKKINMITAILELKIDFIFVKSGQFYYPYDVFPTITEVKN